VIFADSNVLVYLIEDQSERGETVRRRFDEVSSSVAVSPLVAMECRVAPLRRGDTLLARRYEQLIAGMTMLEIESAVYRDAAALRATHGFSTIDAIHLATAQFHVCDAFWTYDRRLAAAAGGLSIEVV
jgi:predicted nucleic acid-binding protein